MYLSNKYSEWYYLIVHRAKCRQLPLDEYVETHHIIPKSLGGSNDLENLVKLTAREHYICHRLLTKMTVGEFRKKMVYAVWCMINTKRKLRYKINSKQYSMIKIQYSNIRKLYKHTEESRQKISIGNIGKQISNETRARMSGSAKKRGNLNTPETIAKSKETKKRNGTDRVLYSAEVNAKRVATRQKNGALQTWIEKSHSPAAREKAAASCRKTYIATNPAGNQFVVTNLKQFCIDNNLTYCGMCHSANGVREYHRGWKCTRI